jgi:hypothetical protein
MTVWPEAPDRGIDQLEQGDDLSQLQTTKPKTIAAMTNKTSTKTIQRISRFFFFEKGFMFPPINTILFTLSKPGVWGSAEKTAGVAWQAGRIDWKMFFVGVVEEGARPLGFLKTTPPQ